MCKATTQVFFNILQTNVLFANCELDLRLEEESQDYCACLAVSAEVSILCRVAKQTPTKPGYFVTVWRRGDAGETEPYAELNVPDYYLIYCRSADGYFLFPKAVLIEKRIVSTRSKEGKRGIRVYPPGLVELNATAKRTQSWQKLYFSIFPDV